MSLESLTPVLPARWQYLRTPPASGAFNMAFDSAMMTAARTFGMGFWRCYEWAHPTVSFGRNELVQGRFDALSVARAGLDAVRRPTGGRALLHAAEVTYSVAVPVADTTAWRAVYAAVNDLLLHAMRSLGVPAQLATAGHEALVRPDGPVCFEQPAPGEIMVNGAKLIGSAVWRERGVFLQHGSILMRDEQPLLSAALTPAAQFGAARIPPAASLSACLEPPPSRPMVASAIETALRTFHEADSADSGTFLACQIDMQEVKSLESHYRDPDWLWRR